MSQQSTALRPLRIFVVENDLDTLTYFTLFLESMGHTVVSARSLEEARAALPGATCDMLISDIGLPDGDGWELLEDGMPVPKYAVVMSGFSTNADRIRSKAAGFRHHIKKPFEPSAIETVVQEAQQEASAAVAQGV